MQSNRTVVAFAVTAFVLALGVGVGRWLEVAEPRAMAQSTPVITLSAAVPLELAVSSCTIDTANGCQYVPPSGTSDFAEVWVWVDTDAADSLVVNLNATQAAAAGSKKIVTLEPGQGLLLPLFARSRVSSVAVYSATALTYGTDYVLLGK